jgi:hypothetical protein
VKGGEKVNWKIAVLKATPIILTALTVAVMACLGNWHATNFAQF